MNERIGTSTRTSSIPLKNYANSSSGIRTMAKMALFFFSSFISFFEINCSVYCQIESTRVVYMSAIPNIVPTLLLFRFSYCSATCLHVQRRMTSLYLFMKKTTTFYSSRKKLSYNFCYVGVSGLLCSVFLFFENLSLWVLYPLYLMI